MWSYFAVVDACAGAGGAKLVARTAATAVNTSRRGRRYLRIKRSSNSRRMAQERPGTGLRVAATLSVVRLAQSGQVDYFIDCNGGEALRNVGVVLSRSIPFDQAFWNTGPRGEGEAGRGKPHPYGM